LCYIYLEKKKKLKQKINSKNQNFNDLDSEMERYDDMNDVYEENCYEKIYEYKKINYVGLNVQQNTDNKYTEIAEYEIMNAIIK
jgi:hypothetical protein